MPDLDSPGRFYVSDLRSLRTPPVIIGPLRRASFKYDLAFGPWLSIPERRSKRRRSAAFEGPRCSSSSRQFVIVLTLISP
jgi:hypothetical protein